MASKKTTSASQFPSLNKKLSRSSVKDLLSTLGGSGTALINGFLESDYNSKLAGHAGLKIYEEMRSSDAQVQASLLVCELPIRSTEWYIEPAIDDETGEVLPEDQEIADFVSQALFEKMHQTWDDFLREALTMLPFGFSLFEEVYYADEDHVWLKNLSFRKQQTILKWEQSNAEPGVVQVLPTPVTGDGKNNGMNIVDIPADKLLLFSFRKEGDNLAGRSILRSSYKHWYIKDILYKYDSVKHERQSVGIPILTLPEDATLQDMAVAQTILEKLRAHEQSGIVLPSPDWKFEFADTKGQTGSDLWKSIEHHNMMISKNVLAMFMDLVSGDGGSRALSEDQSDFFLLGLEAVAKQIDDVVSRFTIQRIVDLNFNDVVKYPKLSHKKLGRVDYQTLTTSISTAVGAEVITPDDDLEAWMRKAMDLPPKMPEEEIEDDGLVDDEGNPTDEDGNPIDPETGEPIEPEPLLDAEGNPIEPDAEDQQISEEDVQLEDLQNELEASDLDAEQLMKFCEKALSFRIVSEETKKKISESLKRARSGRKVEVKKGRRRGRKVQPSASPKVSKNPIRAQIQNIHKQLSKYGKDPKKRKQLQKLMKSAMAQARTQSKKVKKQVAVQKKAAAKKGKTKVVKKKARKLSELEIAQCAERIDNRFVIRLLNSAKTKEDVTALKAMGFKVNDFESSAWRPLTFAERKVNFTSLKKAIEKNSTQLQSSLEEINSQQKEDLLNQVKRAVEQSDLSKVGAIKAKYTGDLKAAIGDVQTQMFEIGKQSAAAEMAVQAPTTAAEARKTLKTMTAAKIDKMSQDMEHAAQAAITELAAKRGGSITNTSTQAAVSAASDAIDAVVEKNAGLHTLSVIGSLNFGRAAIFERFPEKVYAMQYSAIIDDRTTDLCLSLDGRIVEPGSDDFYSYSPPQHYNCRSIWVEILQDEEFKPDIDGIPGSIEPNDTIDSAKDLSAPVVKKNSVAVKVLQEELDDRKAKVEEYESSGLFPNRVAQHKERISDLEKAIADATEFTMPDEFTDTLHGRLRERGVSFKHDIES